MIYTFKILSVAISLSFIFTAPVNAAQKTAIFAGGCFWCMEKPFEDLNGVSSVVSGFSGGHVENPTYKQVAYNDTGHIEVVEITYDDDLVSYERLLETYWANIDPVDAGGQFCDRGHTYKPAIFYVDDEQKTLAETSKSAVSTKLKSDIKTDIIEFEAFYPAEDYHQDYYKTSTTKYKYYRWRCGRDKRLEAVWGDKAGKSVSLFE